MSLGSSQAKIPVFPDYVLEDEETEVVTGLINERVHSRCTYAL